jgi:hypothetical protein
MKRVAFVVVICLSYAGFASAQSEWLYGVDNEEFFRIDPATGQTTLIGVVFNRTLTLSDVAIAPDGSIYASTSESLLRLDLATGIATRVGFFNLLNAVNALTFDSAGRLFGATRTGALVEIDPRTAQARLIGDFGTSLFSGGDIAFAPDGSLFAISASNLLLRISTANGRATVVGDTGFEDVEGIAFGADGRLYGSARGATLITIDPARGTGTPVAVFSNFRTMLGLAALPLSAPPTTLPAPANLQAVVTGLSVLLSWTPVAAATSYVLEAGSGPGLADLFNADIGNATTLPAGAPPGTYYVRVRARAGLAISGPSAEIVVTLPGGVCVAPPPVTGLTAAVDAGVLTLRWDGAAGAATYQLEAGTGPGLANAFIGNVGGSNLQQFSLAAVPPALYYVRVRAVAGCGAVGPPSVDFVLDLR